MYGLTKRTCLFPGCNKFLPRRGHEVHDYCQTHMAYERNPDGWTHQLAWGVFSVKYYKMLMEGIE